MALALCPDCSKEVSDQASTCLSCGCAIREPRSQVANGLAALLSFVFPGLGQLTQGRLIAGIAWFVTMTFVGSLSYQASQILRLAPPSQKRRIWALILVSLLLHLWQVYNVAMYRRRR